MQNTLSGIPWGWPFTAVIFIACVLFGLRWRARRKARGSSKNNKEISRLAMLKKKVSWQKVFAGLASLPFIVLWLALFVFLFFGLMGQIVDLIETRLPSTPAQTTAWRFTLAKVVALTGVFGAVVALPFTVYRLSLTQQQAETAKDALFNDKIDVAVTDLYAQRQVTRWDEEKGQHFSGWQDDITRRNGAIDRLEGLVEEDMSLAPRVSRMLSVYVRELSREDAKPENQPEGWERKALTKWARGLTVKRSDMEKAVQTLGRLPVVADSKGDLVYPDLEGANLQAMRLNDLIFDKAILIGAQLQGADLIRAQFNPDTVLTAVTLRGAAVRTVDFTAIPQIASHLEGLFGDDTVTLPPGVTAPDRFQVNYASDADFKTAWRDFQRSIGQDPKNPT